MGSVALFALLSGPTVVVILMAQLLWQSKPGVLPVVGLMFYVPFLVITPCLLSPRCRQVAPTGKTQAHCVLGARHTFWLAGWLGGIILCSIVLHLMINHLPNDEQAPRLRGDYNPSAKVAVIGGGPSGLAAAWQLAHGGRSVTLFEATHRLGGHSHSYVEESGKNFDLGFIFSAGHYRFFEAFAKRFDHALVPTSLNISSHFSGQYWDNTGMKPDAKLQDEIDRFMGFVQMPQTFWRLLLPFSVWARWNSFSDQFVQGPLTSALSVLFITKMGIGKQSTQSILNHFRDRGFTHLRVDPSSPVKVWRGRRASHFMWEDVISDMRTLVQIELNKTIVKVRRERGSWTLIFSDGSRYDQFSDVVLAVPASVSATVVEGRPFDNLILSQIRYVRAKVTLHTDAWATILPKFSKATKDVLYFKSHSPDHLSGRIARIFGYEDDETLLTVHGQDGHAECPIAKDKIKWETEWYHHPFTLWELFIARKVVPLFNWRDGLHYAGDWLYGIGHEDAIKTGAAAACAVGFPRELASDGRSSELYRKLRSQCKE